MTKHINIYNNIKEALDMPGFDAHFEIRTWYDHSGYHAVTGTSDGLNFSQISEATTGNSEVEAVLGLTTILPYNATRSYVVDAEVI